MTADQPSRQGGLSRRSLLVGAAAGTAGLSLTMWRLGAKTSKPVQPTAWLSTKIPEYKDWRDVYIERWQWDKVVKSTHFVNCWYQAHCAWNVYIREGMVWREEQVGNYPQTNPDVPDFNPRGCQKGACYSERMYDASRIRYPMKRAGERGSGKWIRASWDEVLPEIADAVLDTMVKDGSDKVIWDLGPLYTMGTMSAAHQCLNILIDSTSLDMNTEIGDGHRGTAETFGKIVFERSADDYFYSDLILIWGSNPVFSQIPNAHFLLEARYKGAEIACIAPDYSPSSIHTDLYLPVKPGFDAALGLAMAYVIIEEGYVDEGFIAEQTDMPILVRDDTKLFLRSSDLNPDGSDEELYFYDPARGLVEVPQNSLELDGLNPAIEGQVEVKLHTGETVTARPVYELLKEHIKLFPPDKVASICGTPEPLIRELARKIGRAKSASMVTNSNFSKFYHGNLMERTQALVFALTGNFGKKGSGFVGFPYISHDGIEAYIRSMFTLSDMMSEMALEAIKEEIKHEVSARIAGYTDEMIVRDRGRRVLESGGMTSGALFWMVHGGMLEGSEKLAEWDPYVKRPAKEVLQEAFDKNWQTLWPKPGHDPKMLFVYASNPVRRLRNSQVVVKNLWPKLNQIITLDWRMTSTTMLSDYVLPVTAWYERTEHKWATTLSPFIHAGEKASDYYEAKSDWEVLSRLTEAIDRRAKERGIESFVDRHGNERPLGTLYDHFSHHGKFGHTDDEKVCEALLEGASNLEGVSWNQLKQDGFARFTSVGYGEATIGTATTIKPDETITPLTNHVVDKKPYPTLSRRIQFYLDQELYLEFSETLPTHKDPPIAGGHYPLIMTGGHARWSIHAAQRDQKLLLQQQRGEPIIYISVEDAAARGIPDGARVSIFNDLDRIEVMAKVAAGVRPGQTFYYHAWENFQFKNGKSFQSLIPAPLNPVELAGGQFHLHPQMLAMQPSHPGRDTRVDIELA